MNLNMTNKAENSPTLSANSALVCVYMDNAKHTSDAQNATAKDTLPVGVNHKNQCSK